MLPVAQRPLRADAARNRSKLLTTATSAFSAHGLSISMDDVARTAGVGAGTLYRHFPTKDHLIAAVLDERISELARQGRNLLDSCGPRDAVFEFLRRVILDWGPTDRGLVEALARSGTENDCVPKSARDAFAASLDLLLRAAQTEGTVRGDVSAAEIEALIVGGQAIQEHSPDRAEHTLGIMLAGLTPPS